MHANLTKSRLCKMYLVCIHACGHAFRCSEQFNWQISKDELFDLVNRWIAHRADQGGLS